VFFTPLPALADAFRTILVLDGSGSMWGQIEGEAKISIARTLATFPISITEPE